MPSSTQLRFPMMLSPIAERTVRLDEVTGHVANDANQVSFGFVDAAGNTVWRNVATSASGFTGNDDIVIFANTVTGNDANPGTVALPVKTLDGIVALLPVGHKKLCRAFVTGPILTWTGIAGNNGCLWPPHPIGGLAEPLTIIGSFVDSGLGERTSTAVSVLAGAQGVLVTDNTIVTGLDTWQGFRFRATTGAAAGLYAAIATNTVGGAFTLLVPTLPGFANGDKFVVEQPATTLQHNSANALRLHGPDALGLYGLSTAFLDFEPEGSAVVAMESCWFGSGSYKHGVHLVLGNLRAGFGTPGIGSQFGYTEVSGQDTNGSCTLIASPNLASGCVIFGSYVSRGGPFTWTLGNATTAFFNAAYGGVFVVSDKCMLTLFGTVRCKSSGVAASGQSELGIRNTDISGGPVAGAVVLTGRSFIIAAGLINSAANGGPGISLDTGSGGSIDAASTITGSVPGTNDLAIGLAGNKSQAQLTAAGVISDFTIVGPPASTGVYLKRG